MNKDFFDFDKTPEHTVPEPCAHTLEVVKAAARHETALTHEELERMAQNIVGALKTVYDPEIPLNIYDLGLIYRIEIPEPNRIEIDMTLTAPGCPVAGEIMGWVEKAVEAVDGVETVLIRLVFDPPWDQSRMSEEAKLELGFL